MNTTIPVEIAETMIDLVIYNYISFTNTYDWEQDDAKVICRTTVGDEFAYSVNQVFSDVSFEDETLLFNDEISIPATESLFRAVDDYNSYTTGDNGVDAAWAICTIAMDVNENNWDELESIFNAVYEATYGIKVYDYTTNELTQYAESEFAFWLPSPVEVEDDYDEPE